MKSDFNTRLIRDLSDYEYDLNDGFKNRHHGYEIFGKKYIYKLIKELIQDVRDMRKCVNVLNG